MNLMISDNEPPASQAPDQPTIVRRFLSWAQRADAGGRAEAASALARAYLYSDLDPTLRREAAIGMTSLLDDYSALVRRALAEVLAGACDAPHHIVLALACDQSEVSSVVLARSPVLTDAELVDCAAIGDARAQIALARRPRLGVSVAAALAEIGQREAVIALAGNLDADLSQSVLFRIVERFGQDAEAREALLMRPSLPSTLRVDLVAAAAKALSDFVAGCAWLGAERAERMTREAAEQGTVCVANSSPKDEIRDLVRHLRQRGGLTIALLMRALLSGDRALFESALAELSGLAPARIAGFVREPLSAGFAALYGKTGLPPHFLPAFRAALAALDEAKIAHGDRISRALIERVIAACERVNSPELVKLMSLLRRFEAEAAREEARAFVAESAAHRRAPALLVRFEEGLGDDEPTNAPMLIAAQAPPALEAEPPPVALPPDQIAALAEAA
ncbi:DUF2336 domain-containing protein [Methylocapsa sp. S129]|uniref:DUF2336 domain-containing protein n=1 Tax=Methylocapsa sp. S129 TaxID=1641869 RepID=UPI00131B844B|nr:DUF2336 domain-containing protein [Methylocapsa sp. S129]